MHCTSDTKICPTPRARRQHQSDPAAQQIMSTVLQLAEEASYQATKAAAVAARHTSHVPTGMLGMFNLERATRVSSASSGNAAVAAYVATTSLLACIREQAGRGDRHCAASTTVDRHNVAHAAEEALDELQA